MKKLYALLFSLYLNNIFVILLDIFLIIWAKNYIFIDRETSQNEAVKFLAIIFIIWLIWFLPFLVITIINIISVIKLFIRKELNTLAKYTKVIKFGLIPFWIINFIGYTAFVIMINMPSHGFGIFIVPIPIMASYSVLIITSLFSILFLMLLYKNGILNSKQILIHFIMQICFIFDIISIFYIFKIIKKKNIIE
jgi:hypothetical protein